MGRIWVCLALALTACSRSQPSPSPSPSPSPAQGSPPPAAATPPPSAAPEPDPLTAKGAALYAQMCAVCHGARGEGYAADQAPALAQPDFLQSVSDDYLGFTIAEGRRGTTMSAWYREAGGPLSLPEIRALIMFLRTWQTGPTAQLDDAPPHGDVGRGEAIFARECQRCHGDKGPYVRVASPQLLVRAGDGFLRHALQTGRPPTPMPSYAATLQAQGIEDVVSYLRSLQPFTNPREVAGVSKPPPIPLGPVPLNPKGREPRGFRAYPQMTSVGVVGPELARKAKMVLLDARVPSDYEQQHIAGAVSVPFYDPSPYLEGLPKDAWLVCYCGCPHAESGQLAQKLMAAGFAKVTVLDEGLFAWSDKGYPMSQGRTP